MGVAAVACMPGRQLACGSRPLVSWRCCCWCYCGWRLRLLRWGHQLRGKLRIALAGEDLCLCSAETNKARQKKKKRGSRARQLCILPHRQHPGACAFLLRTIILLLSSGLQARAACMPDTCQRHVYPPREGTLRNFKKNQTPPQSLENPTTLLHPRFEPGAPLPAGGLINIIPHQVFGVDGPGS